VLAALALSSLEDLQQKDARCQAHSLSRSFTSFFSTKMRKKRGGASINALAPLHSHKINSFSINQARGMTKNPRKFCLDEALKNNLSPRV
jgi:hypothetical protein